MLRIAIIVVLAVPVSVTPQPPGSTGIPAPSVRELRWRTAKTAERSKSLSFNRAMVPYDTVMTTVYVGMTIPVALNAPPGSAASNGSEVDSAGPRLFWLT